MHDSGENFQWRKHPRYATCDNRLVTVLLNATVADQPASVRGELLDFARRGAQVRTNCAFKPKEELSLQIRTAGEEVNLRIPARVAWTRPSGSDWLVGCEFVGELPFSVIPQLAENRVLERRSDTRWPISVDARVRQELDSARKSPVQLIDYSAGGFGLWAALPLQAGERLLLELPAATVRPVQIPARCQWSREIDGGFRAGCSFLNRGGFEVFNQAIKQIDDAVQLAARGEASVRSPRQRTFLRWALLGFLATVLTCGVIEIYRGLSAQNARQSRTSPPSDMQTWDTLGS